MSVYGDDWFLIGPLPGALAAERTAAGVQIRWSASPAAFGTPLARRYAVYRLEAESGHNVEAVTDNATYLVALTGETEFFDPAGDAASRYAVTAVSANSVEGAPVWVVVNAPTAVALQKHPEALALHANFPNPFNGKT